MGKCDVVALGELLIDFTDAGLSGQGNPQYEANPGGAPCNVLAMLANLGTSCAFIGKVGKDNFGRQLRESITKVGIDDSGLVEDEAVHTTLAFVHKLPNGDRDFSWNTMIGCPKLDEGDYTDKLTEIIKSNDIRDVTIVRMEVPCCGGLQRAAENALRTSGKFIPWRVVTISRNGEVIE